MKANPQSSMLPETFDFPVGMVSNAGTQRYQLEAESTTGFVAWKLADGTTVVSETTLMEFRPTPYIHFWSCAGLRNTSPSGGIRFFDCHGCGVTTLDVRRCTDLEMLDASFNKITELRLDGLNNLEGLDVEGNKLTELDLRMHRKLRFLNCSSNNLAQLRLDGTTPEFCDFSNNPKLKAAKGP